MAFFSDLLSGVNKRVDYNADDPDRDETPVNMKWSFSAKPKKNIGLDMSKTVECKMNEDGTRTESEKTASKMKWNHGDCTTTYGFTNDKLSFDAKGVAYNEDGMKSNVGLAAENKAAKSEWKITGNFDFKASDLGGAKAALNGSVEYNQKEEITVKPKLNVEVADEFNAGVAAVWDLKTFSEVWPQIVYKPKDCANNSLYWLRADLTRSLAMAGCDQQIKDNIHHSFEAIYGWKDFKGIQGHPLALRAGVEYDLSDQTSLGATGSWDSTWRVQQEVEHKVDSHWTVSATQTFDGSSIGSKQSPYHVGFAAAYKL